MKKIIAFCKLFFRSQSIKYDSYFSLLRNFYKTRNEDIEYYSLDKAKQKKTSDTIFVLGSGPSLNKLSTEQKQIIKQHDSFGINYSFLYDIVPTFHSMEDGKRDFLRRFYEKRIAEKSEAMSKTVFFLSQRHLVRWLHPRLTPLFFPQKTKCCFYWYPETILLQSNRDFVESDFNKSLIYRGSLTVVLDLINRLGYKNIVLLGVDLNTSGHFFDSYDYMQPYIAEVNKYIRNSYGKDKGKKCHEFKYETMFTKKTKERTIEEYFYALNDLYLKPNDKNLYVQSTDNLLSPRIPVYGWDKEEYNEKEL